MRSILVLAMGLQVLSGWRVLAGEKSAAQAVPYLQERLASPWWQVRYVLINELNDGNDPKQLGITKLMADANPQVSSYARSLYLLNYLFVDKQRIVDEMEKFNPMPVGSKVADQEKYDASLRTVAHYVSAMANAAIDDAKAADTIRFFGILAKPDDAHVIERFANSPNDYVQLEAAKALLRMGLRDKGTKTVERILAKDCGSSLAFQTQALFVLRAVDRLRFKAAYRRLQQRIQADPGRDKIKPGWLHEYYVLGLEMARGD
jgi:hypothetical protein